MINGHLSQFLDTGWFNEATLYYKGYTYWCEGCWDHDKEKPMHFFVNKYRAVVHKDDKAVWTSRLIENGKVVDYSTVLDIWGYGEDDVKELFLKAKIFEGKSFWEVENELSWYDEYQINSSKQDSKQL